MALFIANLLELICKVIKVPTLFLFMVQGSSFIYFDKSIYFTEL